MVSESGERIGKTETTGATEAQSTAWLRALLLAAGMVSACILAAWIPWLDRADGGFVLTPEPGKVLASISMPVIGAVLFAGLLGAIGFVAAFLPLPILGPDRRARMALAWLWRTAVSHPIQSIVLLLIVAFGAFDVYELLYDPFNKKSWIDNGNRPFIFKVREDVQTWLYFGAALCAALMLSALWPSIDRAARRLRSVAATMDAPSKQPRWAMLWLAPAVLGALMSWYALDAMPHFSDSGTYLMQGRMLWNGYLYFDKPEHPELFIGSLFFNTDAQQPSGDGPHMTYEGTRFYGKYPAGWPAILGAFDKVGIGFLANAALVFLGTWLTYLLARELATRRIALLASLLFALSPWAYFNAAGFASHVASACAVIAFLWLFVRAHRCATDEEAGSYVTPAIFAGLALGLAVLIRPFDAAMFAIPAALFGLYKLTRDPKRWFVIGVCVAVAATIGVGLYLWTNAQLTGSPFKSPYAQEARWGKDWNDSLIMCLGRFEFQWSDFNGRFPGWGLGGMTLAVVGLMVWRSTHETASRVRPLLWLVMASTGLFFIGVCAFGFTNVWWGPRWMMPVAPLLAILGGIVADQMLRMSEGADNDKGRAAGQLGIYLLVGGMLFVGSARYLGQWYQHELMPPHLVSGVVHAQAKTLDNAVVALPVEGDRPEHDARAGMVFLSVPFEAGPVIYVRAVPDWLSKAKATYPDRTYYEVIVDSKSPGGFVIRKAQQAETNPTPAPERTDGG